MDGLLLIDKPAGPTSHDVVARIRHATGERRVGHTGTLDPRATGLLPLVLGCATRLASFVAAGDKTYEAAICFGTATETDDAEGRPIGEPNATEPADADIDAALASFRGTFDQTPPSHSAKKVGGERAYDRARRFEAVALRPVSVTVHTLERTGREERILHVRVVASAGFYVRALARDLGQRLGCGAHLGGLRRTASGIFDVARALPLGDAERLGPGVAAHLVAPADALSNLPAVELTDAGLARARHGNLLGPEHLAGRPVLPVSASGHMRVVRIVGPSGQLVAVAEARGGVLHPVVVLG